MEKYKIEDVEIIFDYSGRNDWGKFSFPVWYGLPVKVRWGDYRFDFNLRGGWKWISGGRSVWPDAQEMLKRTDANELIYYGVETYASDYDLIKNFYIPYNGVYNFDLFPARRLEADHVRRALEAVETFAGRAESLSKRLINPRVRDFLHKIGAHGREGLAREALVLHRIMGTTLPVLPPDTIDVDYEVIPVIVTDGCDYNCRFCTFKSDGSLRVRSLKDIRRQVKALRDFYGDDIMNYNSILIGQNDALAGGKDILKDAALLAYEDLNLAGSFHKGPPNLFLFGSVDPFLRAGGSFFDDLNRLPFKTFINIGIESFDQETLKMLGKPLTAEKTGDAFSRMLAINREWENVTVSCNFVIGKNLPPRHSERIKKTLASAGMAGGKGTVFLSPLFGRAERREIIKEFTEIKLNSRIPVFIYMAQRL